MILTDVHAHLEFFNEKVDGVVKRAEEAGVKTIITAGIDPATNRQALELAKKYEIVKAAIGLYPIDALKMSEEEIDDELQFIKAHADQIAGIGEIGLDYQETEDRERQQKIFERQIQLAAELDLPIIAHSRKAESAVIATLKRLNASKVVLHAFHGSMALAKEGVDAGFFFSIPANIGRSEHLQRMVSELPLSHMFTETDAPFLAPEKDGQSEPAMVAETVRKIAEIKGTEPEETANMLFQNYQQIFSK